RRRHTRSKRDWSSDVCSSDLVAAARVEDVQVREAAAEHDDIRVEDVDHVGERAPETVEVVLYDGRGGRLARCGACRDLRRGRRRSEERRVGNECTAWWWACVS